MITRETPYKLAEIIQDTWPQLFYLKQEKQKIDSINTSKSNSPERVV
jgi:hypothetical protein